MSSTDATGAPSSSTTRSSTRSPWWCPGGTVSGDLHDLHSRGAPQPRPGVRRQRPGTRGNANVGAPHPAVTHQRADDLPGCRIDRYGETEPNARHRRVDTNHAGRAIHQRAAGVARVECRVNLHQRRRCSERFGPRGPGASGQVLRPLPRCSTAKPFGLPIATTSWPNSQPFSFAQHGRNQRITVGTQHRTARSESGLTPMISKPNSRPSGNVARPPLSAPIGRSPAALCAPR